MQQRNNSQSIAVKNTLYPLSSLGLCDAVTIIPATQLYFTTPKGYLTRKEGKKINSNLTSYLFNHLLFPPFRDTKKFIQITFKSE